MTLFIRTEEFFFIQNCTPSKCILYFRNRKKGIKLLYTTKPNIFVTITIKIYDSNEYIYILLSSGLVSFGFLVANFVGLVVFKLIWIFFLGTQTFHVQTYSSILFFYFNYLAWKFKEYFNEKKRIIEINGDQTENTPLSTISLNRRSDRNNLSLISSWFLKLNSLYESWDWIYRRKEFIHLNLKDCDAFRDSIEKKAISIWLIIPIFMRSRALCYHRFFSWRQKLRNFSLQFSANCVTNINDTS